MSLEGIGQLETVVARIDDALPPSANVIASSSDRAIITIMLDDEPAAVLLERLADILDDTCQDFWSMDVACNDQSWHYGESRLKPFRCPTSIPGRPSPIILFCSQGFEDIAA